jgi:1,4-alpha-glucan branching enzyme
MLEMIPLNINNLIHGNEHDPHCLLGLHETGETKVIRLWRPGAHTVYLEVFGKVVEASKVHEAGLFECAVPLHTSYQDYRVYHQSGLLAHDPYAFLPTVGELDQYLFAKGVHYRLHKILGGRLFTQQGIEGTKFAVWAPGAQNVSLLADFNHWDGRVNPMRSLGHSGIWEVFIPDIGEGEKYKFEIKTQNGEIRVKADPYAYSSQLRPATASVVACIDRFQWEDQEWMSKREAERYTSKPTTIYEVHLGSWRKKDGGFLNYRELAVSLAEYCK